MAAWAVMAGLYHRERTGEAQHVEIPMFETLSSFLLEEHMAAATFEDIPHSFGYSRMLVPLAGRSRLRTGKSPSFPIPTHNGSASSAPSGAKTCSAIPA